MSKKSPMFFPNLVILFVDVRLASSAMRASNKMLNYNFKARASNSQLPLTICNSSHLQWQMSLLLVVYCGAKIVDQSTSAVTCTRIKFMASDSFTVVYASRFVVFLLFLEQPMLAQSEQREIFSYADDFASLLKWKTSFENTTITTTECGWVR